MNFHNLRSYISRLTKPIPSLFGRGARVLWIAASLLWRTTLANLILSILLFGQQQPGVLASQSNQATQLPTSGHNTQSSGTVNAQQSTLQGQGASVVQPSVQVSGSFSGSTLGSELPAGEIKLSLSQAVNRGLGVNLGSITAENSSQTARAQRAQALSQLLPQISANLGATETQINLAAYGLNAIGGGIAGFPTVVGPFHYVQAQGNVSWNAFNLTQIRNYQSSKELERASGFDLRNARELVVLAVGGTYLQVVADQAQVDSQRTQVKYAQAVYDQSVTRLSAGTNTRIDVTRSRVQLQTEQERLISLEADLKQQKITLARLIGIPLDRELVLTEPFGYNELQTVDEPGALRSAFDHRSDLRAAAAQLKAAERTLAAARAERYPTVSASGDYGAIGVSPENSHGVFTATASVNIPIYTGGRIHADMQQADASLKQRQSEYQDEKSQVEQDVRNALIQLQTAIGQTRLADSNRKFALETLTQARDRFEAGVTNTVEVVQAQQQESSAESDYVSSLFAFNLARLTLARATGEAEANVGTLFTGAHP
ncbi:MAG TPA: TolC family protein [Bryobacteraceae bacterium]|nr:TolC family protein [Bryobacteraceae bacterium]